MGLDSQVEVANKSIRVKVGGFIVSESSGANFISVPDNKNLM